MLKSTIAVMLLVFAAGAVAQTVPQTGPARAFTDATVIGRVAEASKRDLPQDLLKRIINEDIELLRGRTADGSYRYATYERLESGRVSDSFSINPKRNKDELQKIEVRGLWVYRFLVESPSRRLLVAKNRRIWVERIEVEYVPLGSTATKTQNTPVQAWLEPGEVRPFDLPEIARQATARAFARGDGDSGYGNVALTLVQARIVDSSDSPYAQAVSSAKALLRAVDNNDVPSIRSLAARMGDSLASHAPMQQDVAGAPPAAIVEVAVPAPATQAAPQPEIYGELQGIEDLLTGSETERRDGMDRLHQLLRRLRTR